MSGLTPDMEALAIQLRKSYGKLPEGQPNCFVCCTPVGAPDPVPPTGSTSRDLLVTINVWGGIPPPGKPFNHWEQQARQSLTD